jgi:hypothetical protein
MRKMISLVQVIDFNDSRFYYDGQSSFYSLDPIQNKFKLDKTDIISKMSNRANSSKKNRNSGSRKGLNLSTTQTPAARNVRVQNKSFSIKADKGKAIICGQEQVATVEGSVTFNATQYHINPGLSLYTWLSTQAKGWEKYRFKTFEVVYVPAEAVTTTSGSVYICLDYDPTDAAPQTLAGLSTYETQYNGRVYDSVSCRADVKRMFDGVQAKKIRCGPVAGDLQLYDAATFSLATVSCANTNAIGQLWVYYEIELISRQTEPTIYVPPNIALFNLSATQTFTTTVAAPLNCDESVVNGMGITNSSGTYTLPCGIYELLVNFVGCDSSAESLRLLLMSM